MPEVIVDTSPLQYLFQLGLLELLPALYGQVLIPEAVAREVAVGRSKSVALPVLDSLPWLTIRKVSSSAVLPLVSDLGAGEREVLALGIESSDPLLILDDALARRFAQRFQLAMTGTLGLLLRAKQIGRVERVEPFLDRLEALHFRLDEGTRASVLQIAGEV